MLKFSLCSSHLYANSVISLITNDLSSLSGKSFISVSLVSYSGSFSCSFIWSKFLCLPILLSFLYFDEIRWNTYRLQSQRDILIYCCCCCEVASVVSDSVRPHRQQPTRLPRPLDSPGKNTGVGCHFLLQCMKVKSESEVAQSCLTLPTPRTAAHQAPLSMGFSTQEHWSGVPLPSLRCIWTSLNSLCMSAGWMGLAASTSRVFA